MRWIVQVTLAMGLLLVIAAPAHAQVEAFDLAVTHDATATDHVVVMTATTTGADQTGPQTLNAFLRSDLDGELRPQAGRNGIQVRLEQVDPRTSRAVVVLPSAGEWVVLPFADLAGSDFSPLHSADQYPIISFSIPWSGTTTRIRPPKSSSAWPGVAAVGGGAVVAGLIVLAMFRLSDRRRSRSAVVAGTDEGD